MILRKTIFKKTCFAFFFVINDQTLTTANKEREDAKQLLYWNFILLLFYLISFSIN